MADYNKTIEIQVRADMKQLLMEMKKMPGMSAKEAKKMVAELSKNYKAAAREAKKAATKQKAAMNSMVAANQRATKSAKSLRMQSREMGAAFGSLEDVVGGLNPELAGMASVVGTVGQGFRSLSRSLATGNPIVLGMVGGLALLAAGYTVLTTATRRAKERQEAFAEATKQTTEKLAKQRDIANQVVGAQRDANRQLAVFTGEMTKLQADIEATREAGSEQLAKQVKSQDEIIEQQKKNIDLVNKARKGISSLTEEETKRLNVIAMQSSKSLINVGIADNSSRRAIQLNVLQDELNTRLSVEQNFRKKIVETNKQTVDKRVELLELQEELRKESEAEARREEQRAEKEAARKAKQAKDEAEARKKEAEELAAAEKEKQRLLRLTADIQQTGEKARQNADRQSIQNARSRISLIDDQIVRLDENAALDQELISQRIASIREQQAQNIALAETEEQVKEKTLANLALAREIDTLKEQSHIREMKHAKERIEAMQRENKKRLELVSKITTGAMDGASAVSQIIQNVNGENKESAMIAFRVSQASALANIAMTTAQKVMEVAPNPFAIAGVTALGALQAGVVATTPPPEFHMGGVIDKGEDTRNITVLTGEAVLDRRTVERLGGDEGINRLQRGEGMQSAEVVVLNPFKHFDRYAMASSKRGGAMAKIGNKRANRGY